jgi:histidinol dehydrogenase
MVALELDTRDAGFEAGFKALLSQKREVSDEVSATVRAIIKDVRETGDTALIALSKRFDAVDLERLPIRVSREELEKAVDISPPEALKALRFAKERIETYHAKQRPENKEFTDSLGVKLGWRWTALESVGLYVPGGSASYPSSVLMNAVPAKVAGVPRVAMVVPAPRGEINPLVLAAASIAGVDEVFRVGGAQAVAALAYGTETIKPVVKIVGPGNAYVAAAKREVFGQVGIDMIAGPSEVVILADKTANAEWVASDLLAQAEHDASAQSILITDSPDLAKAVAQAVSGQLKSLPRRSIAEASWHDFGAIIHVESLEKAIPLIDRLAPEHLEIMAANEDALSTMMPAQSFLVVIRPKP